MLIDEIAQITLKAGSGGPGKVAFGKMLKSGPTGGNGGKGGDVYITAISDIKALIQFSREKLKAAENGIPGASEKRTGGNGKDLTVSLPVGTVLTDLQLGEVIELTQKGETMLVARGGIGGLGNFDLRSARNTTPTKAQKGLPGEERNFKVELKLLADFGLIGLPNSGKSSLINELTAAKFLTADYPFTTLEVNLGVFESYPRKIIADIPGLIEGASGGRGLGIKFLKHIEKVGLLLHCIASNSEDIKKDYLVIRKELEEYSPKMMDKEEMILMTKSDLASEKELKEKLKILKKFAKKVLPVSIYNFESIEALKKELL